MKSKISILLISSLLFTVASSLSTVKVLQGPGSRTTVYGPDGAAVDSAAPGGTVITDVNAAPGIVAAGPAVLPYSKQIFVDGGSVGRIVTSYSLAGPAVVPALVRTGHGDYLDY